MSSCFTQMARLKRKIKVGRTVTRKKRATQQNLLDEEDTNMEAEVEDNNMEETPEVVEETTPTTTPRYALRARSRIQAEVLAELDDDSLSSASEDE